MKMTEACGEKLSALGFGCMRLPAGADGSIDQGQAAKKGRETREDAP